MLVPTKTIGLIGGMSWESTLPYYRIINQHVRHACGGLHSAKLLRYSVNFHEIERLQHAGDWEGRVRRWPQQRVRCKPEAPTSSCCAPTRCTALLTRSPPPHPCRCCTSPMPPPMHWSPRASSVSGCAGTRFTMEQPFYRERLEARGLDVLVPPAEARAQLHRVIYDELCQGMIKPESRDYFRQVMADLGQHGAQAIILGCTEISLLVDSTDAQLPLFDTTALHAKAAALASVSG